MRRFIFGVLAALALLPSVAWGLSQSSIPAKFGLVWGANAGAPYIRSIPQSSQIGIQNCAASLNDGFPPLTFTPSTAGGCPPFGQDFNGILKQLSQWAQWQSAGGPVFYDSGFATSVGGYPSGAILSSAVTPGTRWISTVDNNTTNPDAGGAGWAQDPGQIPTGTPVQSLSTTIPFGYVSANGLTIGDASSNATQRANADTLFLFVFNWNTCTNTQCPIFTSGGGASTRGGSCTVASCADYAAHKALATPVMAGNGLMGSDNQGARASNALAGVPIIAGSQNVPGSVAGENTHTLTLSQIPTGITSSNTQTITVSFGGGNSAPITTGTWNNIATVNESGVGGNYGKSTGAIGNASGMSGSNSISVTSNNTGGLAHNLVELSTLVYWNQKL